MDMMQSKKVQSKTSPPYRGDGLFGFLGRYLINPEIQVLDILDTSNFLLVKALFYGVTKYYKSIPACHPSTTRRTSCHYPA